MRRKVRPVRHRSSQCTVVHWGFPGVRARRLQRWSGRELRYFAFSIFVTVYPDAASSASKVTLSPTFTCLSIAASLTR
ncbi:hypothetical protein FBZ96_110162 [Bradyrhizobium stylosanthis]|uniref:Uncharacterized protein n=1 Tax=Bradyrhizobium stylosanthis TaxID=1803665 RepID=A0A560D6J0_9BRAD|nr:hypothetical protein FBZ96_110162 [Bradyrhizobium stylosanthis]